MKYTNIEDARKSILKDKSLNWVKSTKYHILSPDKDEYSNEVAAALFGNLSVSTDFVHDTAKNRTERPEEIGKEFVRANVSVNNGVGDDTYSSNYRVDRDVKLLPPVGTKTAFADMLPYIIKDSIEVRTYVPTECGKKEGKTSYRRIFWRWDTEKLANANCPFKVENIDTVRERVDDSNSERGFVSNNVFTDVEMTDEFIASLWPE